MKFALSVALATLLAAGCVSSAPAGNKVAANEQTCSTTFIQSQFGATVSVPTRGSEKYCRQIQEENQRYSERFWQQRRADAEPRPDSPPET